jgi:hypothetical protein
MSVMVARGMSDGAEEHVSGLELELLHPGLPDGLTDDTR